MRSIGMAPDGAVRVGAGADQVLPPRLPIDPPPPGRAIDGEMDTRTRSAAARAELRREKANSGGLLRN
ncbi:hypothetical protein AA23498_3301 [Acetobacter nitrogenifigens DSM 23921 = NBRC 105050]|nr:hypothetical protein AA23498_3301 [Acetobacter nitrogenifigens DSM 23921 = NBRC 105050]